MTNEEIKKFIDQKLPANYPDVDFSKIHQYAQGYYAALFEVKMRLEK